MTLRRPLVLIGGQKQELPTVDSLIGGVVGTAIAAAPAIALNEAVVCSYAAAANELAVGTTLEFIAYCTQAGVNTNTPTVRIRIGTTTLTGNIAGTLVGAAGTTAVPSVIEGLITIRTVGATGSAIASIIQTKSGLASVVGVLTATVAVNTTVANLIELTFTSGIAGNTYTFQQASVTKVVA